MPTIRQITLPDGVTYDLVATAINREVVPIVTEYSGSETTFNALEVTEDSLGRTFFNINNPIGNPILQWIYDGSDEVLGINGDVSVGGLFNAYGGAQFNNGGLYFDNSTALPQQTDGNTYNVLVFDAFSAGGRVKFAYATYAATASRIVSRNASGDVCARYYNTSCGAENPASYTSYAAFIDSNGYLRKSSLANFRAWISLVPSATKATYATLNYLGNTTSSTAKSFTVNSNATEFVVSASFSGSGTVKIFTSSIPRNLLNATTKEVWLTGGKGGASGMNDAARVLVNVSLNTSTGVLTVKGVAANDGTTNTLPSTTFYVYQR